MTSGQGRWEDEAARVRGEAERVEALPPLGRLVTEVVGVSVTAGLAVLLVVTPGGSRPTALVSTVFVATGLLIAVVRYVLAWRGRPGVDDC